MTRLFGALFYLSVMACVVSGSVGVWHGLSHLYSEYGLGTACFFASFFVFFPLAVMFKGLWVRSVSA